MKKMALLLVLCLLVQCLGLSAAYASEVPEAMNESVEEGNSLPKEDAEESGDKAVTTSVSSGSKEDPPQEAAASSDDTQPQDKNAKSEDASEDKKDEQNEDEQTVDSSEDHNTIPTDESEEEKQNVDSSENQDVIPTNESEEEKQNVDSSENQDVIPTNESENEEKKEDADNLQETGDNTDVIDENALIKEEIDTQTEGTIEDNSPTTEAYFRFEPTTQTIVEYLVDVPSLIIPDTIGGVQVMTLISELFKGSSIEDVTFTSNISEIPDGLFENCTKLSSIINMTNITSIGYNAFKGCTSLRSISLPDGLTSIGHGAFNGCTGLRTVYIPDNVTAIGEAAFSGCTSLREARLSTSLTTIEAETFRDCSSLVDIEIPDSVTEIRTGAFRGCANAKTLTLPTSLVQIRSSAFKGCSTIQKAIIPDGVTIIEQEAFQSCTSLDVVDLPASVGIIGARAFSGISGSSVLIVWNPNVTIATNGLGTKGTIVGYEGSTAQEYAKSHSMTFVLIDVVQFVRDCYDELLDRGGVYDDGQYEWVKRLANGYGASQMVADFVSSKEFASKPYGKTTSYANLVTIIKKLYQAMLGRAIDPTGLAGYTALPSTSSPTRYTDPVGYLVAGCSPIFAVANIGKSTEFTNRVTKWNIKPGSVTLKNARDKNGMITKFVDHCYDAAFDRHGFQDPDGCENWCSHLVNRRLKPANVVKYFLMSAEANTTLSDSEFVKSAYHIYLFREPEASGWANWVSWLTKKSRGWVADHIGSDSGGEFKKKIAKYYGL